MTPERLIPVIWVRLVALVAFGIFLFWQEYWFVAIIAAVLVLVSIIQLVIAYRQRG